MISRRNTWSLKTLHPRYSLSILHLIEWNQAWHSCLSETWVTAGSTSESHLCVEDELAHLKRLACLGLCAFWQHIRTLCYWSFLHWAVLRGMERVPTPIISAGPESDRTLHQYTHIHIHTFTRWFWHVFILTRMCNQSQRNLYKFTTEVCILVATQITHAPWSSGGSSSQFPSECSYTPS